ncbi:MAG TPA: hypothetical protein VHO95_07040 [Candidatus Dormibacteraeota bacterium]|nr:hypothetical protein [Candidatus Dormibacteraeota bacterium]HEX2682261.1 hypothetical protein [Candidatus Dormibacteraeota bacterium]
MWKEILVKILESCMYLDPNAYMYYAIAKREAEEMQLQPVADGTAVVWLPKIRRAQNETRAAVGSSR